MVVLAFARAGVVSWIKWKAIAPDELYRDMAVERSIRCAGQLREKWRNSAESGADPCAGLFRVWTAGADLRVLSTKVGRGWFMTTEKFSFIDSCQFKHLHNRLTNNCLAPLKRQPVI